MSVQPWAVFIHRDGHTTTRRPVLLPPGEPYLSELAASYVNGRVSLSDNAAPFAPSIPEITWRLLGTIHGVQVWEEV